MILILYQNVEKLWTPGPLSYFLYGRKLDSQSLLLFLGKPGAEAPAIQIIEGFTERQFCPLRTNIFSAWGFNEFTRVCTMTIERHGHLTAAEEVRWWSPVTPWLSHNWTPNLSLFPWLSTHPLEWLPPSMLVITVYGVGWCSLTQWRILTDRKLGSEGRLW